MADLYTAVGVIFAASVLTLVYGLRLARRTSRRGSGIACTLLVAFLVAHVLLASDRLWVTRVLPFSNVAVLGNWLLPGGAMLVGVAWRLIPGPAVRRGVLLVPLLGLCVHRTLAAVLARPPADLVDRWRGGVCVQSSPATCSPAAAATLLRVHGIDATEEELARLCLTSDRGTTNHGLYRGLKLKTAGTQWDVQAFRADVSGLVGLGPAILNVRLDAGGDVDPRYERLWGWTPGVSHTVVFFRFPNDDERKVEIGDPGVGREHWSTADLHVLWKGEGLRLVKR